MTLEEKLTESDAFLPTSLVAATIVSCPQVLQGAETACSCCRERLQHLLHQVADDPVRAGAEIGPAMSGSGIGAVPPGPCRPPVLWRR